LEPDLQAALTYSKAGIPCTLAAKAVLLRHEFCGSALRGKVVLGLRKIDPFLAHELKKGHAFWIREG
jgi:hypothetical protein